MKTRFAALAALLALSAVLIAGCGDKPSEQAQGVWKIDEKSSGYSGFIEISADKLRIDDAQEFDVALDDKDGKVAMRRAGTDEVLGIISVIDENTLELSADRMFGPVKVQLIRSSKEDLNALYHPPVERITGIWRGGEGNPADFRILEIAADAITMDGKKTAGGFTTQKGQYVFRTAAGEEWQRFVLQDDGTLKIGGSEYIRSSAEEAAGVAQAKLAAVEPHLGFWSEARQRWNEPLTYLELGENSIDENGKITEAAPVYASGGKVEWFRDGDEAAVMSTTLAEGGLLETRKGYSSYGPYKRSDRETLEKFNKPELEQFIGYWLLEKPESGGFLSVEIGADYVVRDNMREPTRVRETGVNYVNLASVHPPQNLFFATLSHVGGNRMEMRYDRNTETHFLYRRVEKSEYDLVAAKSADPLSIIPGFWRSEQQVADQSGRRQVYATAIFTRNAQGRDGNTVDRASYHFISPTDRNVAMSKHPTVREGVFMIVYGSRNNPVVLIRDSDIARSSIFIRVIDHNTLDIANNGKDYIRCVRSTEEEVQKSRAYIDSLY